MRRRNLTRKEGGKAAGKLHAQRAADAYLDDVWPLIRKLVSASFTLSAIADALSTTKAQTLETSSERPCKWDADPRSAV